MKRWLVAWVVCVGAVWGAEPAWAVPCPSQDQNCTCPTESDPCAEYQKFFGPQGPGKPDAYQCVLRDRDGAQCRASAGGCDAPEYCDGFTCPSSNNSDARPSGYVCREAAGPCDLEDTCNGTSKSCSDRKRASGEICRQAAGGCDVADECDGQSNACVDVLARAETPCEGEGEGGGNDGKCDRPDYCTGTSARCPSNVVVEGTVCRDPQGLCDPAETCDGESEECPSDAFLEDGFLCDDGNSCTDDDMCMDGACTGVPIDMCVAPDAGATDAGPEDAGTGDSGPADPGAASDAGIGTDGGGGCRLISPGDSGGLELVLALAALVLLRRRRR